MLKRVYSLLAAVVLLFSIALPTSFAQKPVLVSGEYNDTIIQQFSSGGGGSGSTVTPSQIFPDLSGMYMPPSLKPQISESDGHPTTPDIPLDDSMGRPNNGKPGQFDIPPDAIPAQVVDEDEITPFSFPASPSVGSTYTIKCLDNYPDAIVNMTTTLAAKGTYCNVYVESNIQYTPQAVNFLPSGTTPHSNATAIANEFDNYIYSMVESNFGAPSYITGTSKKINIMLYDIDLDGSSTNGYIAGYFHGIDYYPSHGNGDTIIYIDIGTNQGYNLFKKGAGTSSRAIFYGTVTHELQHLINFSKWFNQATTYASGDAEGDYVAVWYNEGLSGLADSMYMKSKGFTSPGDEKYDFLANNFYTGVGYVPTRAQWNDTSRNSNKIYSNYGASSALMQEYYASGAKPSSLVSSPKVGYTYSKSNVGQYYWAQKEGTSTKGFDDFFTVANLNIQVDSPAFTDTAVTRYYTDIFDNTWQQRYNNYIPATAITPTTTASSATFNTGSRTYYTNTYASSTHVGANGKLDVTIPSSSKAKYYIITPYNATSIGTDALWRQTPKMAAQIPAGTSTITVGSNNMFGILAVAYDTAINESFTYEIAATPPVITTAPQAAACRQNDTISLSAVAMAARGGSIVIRWYSCADTNKSGAALVKTENSANSTYPPPTTTVGNKYYYIEVTETVSGKSASVSSTPVLVRVIGTTEITGANLYTSSVYLYISPAETRTGTVVLAFYSGTMLKHVITQTGVSLTANQVATVYVPLSGFKTSGLTMRAMLWDNLSSMTPLAKPYLYN